MEGNRRTDTKFEQIKLLLSSTNSVDVLFLIETFLNFKPNLPDCIYEIPGYCFFRKDRHGCKHGGGIIAYASQNLDVKRVEELEEDDLEIMWLNVILFTSTRSSLCGALYRPTSTNASTDRRLEWNIESAYLKNKKIHILGDFNIDYLKHPIYSNHQLSKALNSMHLVQVVKSVTRPASSTCLDHVYTSHEHLISHLLVPNIGLADHLPVSMCCKYTKKWRKQTTSRSRDMKNMNTNELLASLNCISWDTCFTYGNIDNILNSFQDKINTIEIETNCSKLPENRIFK